MPPNATCHANYCFSAVVTRSGRLVTNCGAVWVDEAGDREHEVCGTFKDENFTSVGYAEWYAEWYAEMQAKYAANNRAAVDAFYVWPEDAEAFVRWRSVWVWVTATGCLVSVLVVGLAAAGAI